MKTGQEAITNRELKALAKRKGLTFRIVEDTLRINYQRGHESTAFYAKTGAQALDVINQMSELKERRL